MDLLRGRLRAALDGGPALAVPTSGSTGEPKSVLLPGSALLASAAATHARLGGPGTWLLALPTTHIAGIQVLVRSLVAGTTPAELAGPFRGKSFTEAAADVLAADGPRYTALVPTQLTRVLEWGGDALAALRSFDAVLIGGAALAPPVLAAAREAGVRVVRTYGMTETAGGCVYDGLPLDGVSVEITAAGLVRLGGPTVAHGYAGSAPFGGWFTTSDLGELVDGRLQVLGRADDLINTGGEKVAPAAVEAVLLAQPGVRAVCVVGVPDPEWGQRVAALVVGALSQDALAAVRAALGAAAVPRRVVTVDALPEKAPGKVDRAAAAALAG
ncbi:o-succinylbenzoate--CoA ligase [Actinokineospora guangxiensis]|uniref:O-succinylbenzoate--CoA ligase n=1 Tax=Actinokineospora guangxiensis TaxID=1490288 RepID=A0ABW0EKB1_9PSEU